MPDPVPIPSLPAAGSLTGAEDVPIDQGGTTKRTTTQAIANLAEGGVTSVNAATGAILLDQGSNITITESPTGTFTFAAEGGAGWLPVTWNDPVGGTATDEGNNIWYCTPAASGTPMLSDIAVALEVGDTLEIFGAHSENVETFLLTLATTTPYTGGEFALIVGTAGGDVYFTDSPSAGTVTSPGGVNAVAYTPFQIQGIFVEQASGGGTISWTVIYGGQVMGGCDGNTNLGSSTLGSIYIGFYQSAGSPAVQKLMGLQYRVIRGTA
jgi:hypothetical protein